MVNHRLVLDLDERVGAIAQGATVTLPLDQDDPHPMAETVAAWCARTGNELVEVRESIVTVRRGQRPDPLAELAPHQLPGTRLWMYTNFDCNLACDYWHPVGADPDHPDQLVTRDLFPLAAAITEIRRRFIEHRARANAAAQWFSCA